jgi:hypothetical protein
MPSEFFLVPKLAKAKHSEICWKTMKRFHFFAVPVSSPPLDVMGCPMRTPWIDTYTVSAGAIEIVNL